MGAETELKGVIKLSADVEEARKQIEALPESDKGDAESSEWAAIGKMLDEALEKNKSKVQSFSQFLGKEVETSLTNSIAKSFSTLGTVGDVLGRAFKNTVNASARVASNSSAAGGSNGSPPVGSPIFNAIGGIGGIGGGGGATPGVAAGAAGGGMGAVGAIGIAGIAIAAIGAAVGMFVKLATTLKEVIASVVSFGRSLSDVSASMAGVFAMFDIQMMLLKRQLGEQLAPAMNALLNQIFGLAKDALPLFSYVMKAVIYDLAAAIQQIHVASSAAIGGVIGSKNDDDKKAGPSFGGGIRGAALGGTGFDLPLLGPVLKKLDMVMDKWMGTHDADVQANVLGGFRDFLMDEKSEQSKYEQQIHNARAAKTHQFDVNGPTQYSFRIRRKP